MNSSNVMSFKAKINNYAKKHKIAAQVVLQNFMFERFLQRLSMSKYRDKFVIKGGILVASIVGLDTRSTMDLDTTLRGLPLTEEKIKEAIHILTNTKNYDKKVFLEALQATAAHRGTSKVLIDKEIILKQIVQSKALEEMWNKYRKKFEYAKSIEYSQVMDALRNIVG